MPPQGGSMITPGQWVHKYSGKKIFVRDAVIDGDKMIVLTDIGQIAMSEFSNNYIQCDEMEGVPTLDDLYGHKAGEKNNSLLSQINQGIPKEDRLEYSKPKNVQQYSDINIISNDNLITTDNTNDIGKVVKEQNKNYDLIKKVFDKFPVERTINFEIIDEEWPIKEFNMLINVLDVPIKDICDYIIDNYLDKNSLSNKLSEYFNTRISV